MFYVKAVVVLKRMASGNDWLHFLCFVFTILLRKA